MANQHLPQLTVRIFKVIMVAAGFLLMMLVVDDWRTQQAIATLKTQSHRIEKIKDDIVKQHELVVMASRMAITTGEKEWQMRLHQYQRVLDRLIQQAAVLSPEIYRHIVDISNIAAVDKLNNLLTKQVEAALALENSKADMARIAVISVLIMLLVSWLVILRVSRRYQDELIATNKHLMERTEELNILNKTLDLKVQERSRALESAQRQLFQTEKMASIGQLAAGMAHEINNPIGFINSNLQTLHQYVMHYSKLVTLLNKMDKNDIVSAWKKMKEEINFDYINDDVSILINESKSGVLKVSRIVADLKNFAAADNTAIDAVNVEETLDSMINIVWNEIKYKAELVREYHHVPSVMGNPQKISQAFLSILRNAAHAIKQKGTIIVRTLVKGNMVCVDVKDNGSGIKQEHLSKIFDPFFTTKNDHSHKGLGLSLCYDMIKKHGGDIIVHTTWGEGTTFTVMLPLS